MLCRSIAEKGYQNICSLIKGAQMAEIRIEKSKLSVNEVRKLFSEHNHLLATCRPEGLTDQERIHLLKAAIYGGAQWVDIEIESTSDYKKELIAHAKACQCRVIISYHNYSETPDNEMLNSLLIEGVESGADLIKIATQVQTSQDASRLLALYQYKVPVLALGMGGLGKITRIAALALGAPFTFVRGDAMNETAPGQLLEKDVKVILKTL